MLEKNLKEPKKRNPKFPPNVEDISTQVTSGCQINKILLLGIQYAHRIRYG